MGYSTLLSSRRSCSMLSAVHSAGPEVPSSIDCERMPFCKALVAI